MSSFYINCKCTKVNENVRLKSVSPKLSTVQLWYGQKVVKSLNEICGCYGPRNLYVLEYTAKYGKCTKV